MTALDWFLTVCLLVTYVIGNNTIGKTIEDAWKQTKSYSYLVKKPGLSFLLFVIMFGSFLCLLSKISD